MHVPIRGNLPLSKEQRQESTTYDMVGMEIDGGPGGLQEHERQRVGSDGWNEEPVSYAARKILPHNQDKEKEKYGSAQDCPAHRHFGIVGEGKLKQPDITKYDKYNCTARSNEPIHGVKNIVLLYDVASEQIHHHDGVQQFVHKHVEIFLMVHHVAHFIKGIGP